MDQLRLGAPQARAGVAELPRALPTGGRAGQELQPLGGGGSSLHGVGESHVPHASPEFPASGVGPPPLHCPPGSSQGQLLGQGLSGGAGRRTPSWWERRSGGTVLWAGRPCGSCGAWAWWLWLEQVLGGSERPSWSFLCLGPPARPREGTLDSHRNGAGTFISGNRQGRGVGRQASGQGASPRPRSWESAGLPGLREPAFHCSHLPEDTAHARAHLHPLPCGLPEPGPAGALKTAPAAHLTA